MKSFPNTLIVLILTSIALVAFGCEQKAEVTQDQPAVEENAPVVQEETEAVEVSAPIETVEETPTAVEPAPTAEQTAAAAVEAPEPATAEVIKQEVAEQTAAKEEPAEKQPAPQPQETATQTPAAEEVAVTVDGVVITEAQVDESVDQAIQVYKKQGMPDEAEQEQRKMLRPSRLEGLITGALLDAEIKRLDIQPPTAEELDKEMEKIAAFNNWTIEEFLEKVKESGQTIEEVKERYKKPMTYSKLLYSRYPDECEVTEEEAKQYYDSNPNQYNFPERVRASHILIKPDTSDPNADPNETKAAGKAKAEVLLKQVKEGADFAELAKENSACNSAPRGGDLGFFKRGQMTAPFDEAAFSLEVGQISGVVETEFGFHIIKVTDKQEAKITSFDEAKERILAILRRQKENRIGVKYISELKDKAKIEYPEGKEPQAPEQQPGEGRYQETQ